MNVLVLLHLGVPVLTRSAAQHHLSKTLLDLSGWGQVVTHNFPCTPSYTLLLPSLGRSSRFCSCRVEMLLTVRTHAASASSAAARRIPAARRALHSSARVCAKVKAQRASPAPLQPNSFTELRGPEFLTVLPTPLPVGEQSAAEHQHYFPDSNAMALVAIVDACLTNYHDIPRAQSIFAELRRDRKATSFIDVRVFNRFLQAYFTLAENPVTPLEEAEQYRMQAWELYKSMVENNETVEPNSHTSALMLRGLLRYTTLTSV